MCREILKKQFNIRAKWVGKKTTLMTLRRTVKCILLKLKSADVVVLTCGHNTIYVFVGVKRVCGKKQPYKNNGAKCYSYGILPHFSSFKKKGGKLP